MHGSCCSALMYVHTTMLECLLILYIAMFPLLSIGYINSYVWGGWFFLNLYEHAADSFSLSGL